MCKDASEYRWSSHNDYLRGCGLTDTEFALSMFREDRKEARLLHEKYMDEEEKISCLDLEENRRLTDKEAQELIKKLCGTKNIAEFQNLTQERQAKSIVLLKKKRPFNPADIKMRYLPVFPVDPDKVG